MRDIFRAAIEKEQYHPNYVVEGKELIPNTPLWEGFQHAKRLERRQKIKFKHPTGFINFAKDDYDTIWYQKGRKAHDWIAIETEYVPIDHPIYIMDPRDPIPQPDKFAWEEYVKKAELATVEVNSNTDVNKSEFSKLSSVNLDTLKREIVSRTPETFVWNSHGIWKKGQPLENGKHRYLAIRLYHKRGHGSLSMYYDFFNYYEWVHKK